MKALMNSSYVVAAIFLTVVLNGCKWRHDAISAASQSRTYYVNASGNDSGNGDKQHPLRSVNKVSSLLLNAGDTVLFEGGQTFEGTLIIQRNGAENRPVTITSSGTKKAVINSGRNNGISIINSTYINLHQLKITGAGRKMGNTADGVVIERSSHVKIDSLSVSGYQNTGLLLHSSSHLNVQNVHAYENGYAGIAVQGALEGKSSKLDCRNILLKNCIAENNPGSPVILNNHSGNGIVVSQCTNLTIAYCTATNNGWDMPRTGNGPVGIWAWDADSVVIEHCLSYRNKTSAGGEDGGGYDFDGGVTNSVIQYCLSYENQGSGIGLFQYRAAKPWYNNTVRYNISVNDGRVSAAKAGIYIWNESAVNKLKDCNLYNNVIYNKDHAAIRYAPESGNEGFAFYNNIFVGRDEIIAGNEPSGIYIGNDYWNLSEGFNISGIKDFSAWAITKKKELINGKITGFNINPDFNNTVSINITKPGSLSQFFDYKTSAALKDSGIDLTTFGIKDRAVDFNGHTAPEKGIGASF